MDVYHNDNIWEQGRLEDKLTPFPVNQTFLWGQQEIFIPAVYVGKAGAVLDVCAKIPTEDMAAFLKKWDEQKRLSLKTEEDFEQIDADNPASREFAVEMCLDQTLLVRRMSSSLRWYPQNIIQIGNGNATHNGVYTNDYYAEKCMETYSCDRDICWYFERLSYNWSSDPILSPQKIALDFQANPLSITTGHFTTGVSCSSETIKTYHPVTGEEYILTLYGCEQTRHSFAKIGAKDVDYPEYSQVLSYNITPQIDRSLFDIRDCAEGDKPRKRQAQEESHTFSGPTSVFSAKKSTARNRRTAVSSLHFMPVPVIRWRIIFQIKPKEDIKVSFPLSHCSFPGL